MEEKVVSLCDYRKSKEMDLDFEWDGLQEGKMDLLNNLSVDMFMIERNIKKRLTDKMERLFESVERKLKGLNEDWEEYEEINERYELLQQGYQRLLRNKKKKIR